MHICLTTETERDQPYCWTTTRIRGDNLTDVSEVCRLPASWVGDRNRTSDIRAMVQRASPLELWGGECIGTSNQGDQREEHTHDHERRERCAVEVPEVENREGQFLGGRGKRWDHDPRIYNRSQKP